MYRPIYQWQHVQPPEILGDGLQGFETTWVSSYIGVVTEQNYFATEVRGVQDINAAMVIKEAVMF